MRWGQRMGDGATVDAMVGALTDPFDDCHMGVTAENVAKNYRCLSRRPGRAGRREPSPGGRRRSMPGYFNEQIVPVEVAGQEGHDHVRHRRARPARTCTVEDLARLRPVFAKDGTVTAGNASGINDAAAAVVLATRRLRRAARADAARPAGRLQPRRRRAADHGHRARCRPCRKVLDRAGLKLDDIDVFEVNEAFAAQALAVVPRARAAAGQDQPERQRHLARPPDRRHRRASSPSRRSTSCTAPAAGTRLVTMCIGGGQGIAAIFERL